MSKPNWAGTGRPDGAGHLEWSALAEGAIDELVDAVVPLELPADNPNAVARVGSGAHAIVRQSVMDDAIDTATSPLQAALKDRGNYNPAASYDRGDLVTYEGNRWVATPATATLLRTNLWVNPTFGAGTHLDWSVVAATRTIIDGGGRRGGYCSEMVGTSAGSVPYQSTVSIPVTPGETYTASIYYSPQSSGQRARLRAIWYDAADAIVVNDTTPAYVDLTVSPGEWQRVSYQRMCPAGATHLRILAIGGAESSNLGVTFRIDDLLVEQTDEVRDYFDGDSDGAAWSGTPHRSTSSREETITLPVGAPADDGAWVRLTVPPVDPGPGPEPDPPRPIGTLDADPEPVTANTVPLGMNRARTRLWVGGSLNLRESVDEGATWTTIHTFPGVVGPIREFANGELAVCASPPGGADGRSIWVSEGFPTLGAGASWTEKVAVTDRAVSFTSAWSIFVHDSIGLFAEYGPKQGFAGVEAGDNARYVYLTVDNGKTWQTIFDVNDHVADTYGIHLHGVAYDRWWDRLWVTYGDSINGTMYSDDLGETWHHAHVDTSSEHQNVGILPMPDCILFGTDCGPNGVHRINRSEGKHTGLYPIEVAYDINPGEPLRTHLCHGISWPKEDAPAFFAFGAETRAGVPQIVATRDGYHFETVWAAPQESPAGSGLRSVLGPTIRGQLFARMLDTTNYPQSWMQLKGPAPGY